MPMARTWCARAEGVVTKSLPTKWDELIIAVDSTFKKSEDSDLVCIGVMGRLGPDKFLLDVCWDKMTFGETRDAIADLILSCRKRWNRQPDAILIEDKANGEAIIDQLKTRFSRVMPVSPGKDSKESRLLAVTGEMESGCFWLPLEADWVSAAVEELVTFPKAAHDDFVDMVSYALLRLSLTSAAAKFERLSNFSNIAPNRHRLK
jgi:predicted phage terminase large subunit-like protein